MSKHTIMVLDDEKYFLEIVDTSLKRDFPYKVAINLFENALDGLESCSQKKYDLIISDYSLPRLNGQQFLKKLRECKNNKSAPVIMMSGHQGIFESGKEFEGLGKLEFIYKPFKFSTLTQMAIKKLNCSQDY